MKLQDFLQRLQRRLRDDGVNSNKYDELELIASINQEQNIIISDFELNVNYFKKEITEQNNTLQLPKITLKIIHAKLNGQTIPLKNYKYMIENTNPETHLMTFSNMQTLGIYPKEKANGLLEVWSNICVFCDNLEEELFLNDLFVNLLLYGCLKNILQSENSETSLQKMQFYEVLYKNENSRLKSIVANTREKEILFSKVNRI